MARAAPRVLQWLARRRARGFHQVTKPDESLEVYLLGPFRVIAGGQPVPADRWPRRKCGALIKRLALSPGHEMHRDQAMEALWPGTSMTTAANNLNKVILMTRRALEPGLASGADSRFLQRATDRIRLTAEPLAVDVATFEQKSIAALRGDEPAAFVEALAHYAGDLLVEDRYDEWALAKREQLRLRYLDLLQGLADLQIRRGERQEAVEQLSKLLEFEPANEEAHRSLMKLHADSGRREAALRQFDVCREALRRSLDTAPDRSTVELKEKIASGGAQATVVAAAAPPVPAEAEPEPARGDQPRTLAVLPFRNESDDEGLAYLVDGITETLIHKLSRLPRLRVLARSTVFRRESSDADPLDTARSLGVDVALVGRVVQWGERLAVSVELVSVEDGAVQWGERYDRPRDDIFAVEEEISRDISSKLRLRLTRVDDSRLGRRQTQNTDAYQDYLRGRFHWNKRTNESIRKAIGFFESALDSDPAYALAYCGLADGYNLLALYGDQSPRTTMPRAKAAAEQALRIDDSLAEARTSLAYARFYYDWDWRRAEDDFRTAIDWNPGYATARHWYHELLTARGRFDEAREQIRTAEQLDPLSIIIKTDVGWGRYFARDYGEAAHHLDASLEMDPRFAVARLVLGLVLLQQGDAGRAVAEIEESIRLSSGPFPLALAYLGFAHARADARDRAVDVLARLGAEDATTSYCRAIVHTALGEQDTALELLGRAVDERFDRLVYLSVDPVFDGLRSHPGTESLLQSINLS